MKLIEDNLDLTAYMNQPETVLVKPASHYCNDVIAFFHSPPENRYAPKLPWSKTHGIFEFRAGETTLVAGINSHGKTMVWSQVILYLLAQRERVLNISLEMQPVYTMARMTRQAAGFDEPSIKQINAFSGWTDGKLWIFDHFGYCAPEKIVALIRYAHKELGITHVVIDNMTRVITGEDNYNGQKDFISAVCSAASEAGVHCHIVSHVRKGMDEKKVPNKMDVKGGGSIVDMIDNLFIVWRNKEKEESVRNGEVTMLEDADCILRIEKQRNARGVDGEGTFLLWYDRLSQQYLEDRHAKPRVLRPLRPENIYRSEGDGQVDYAAGAQPDGRDV